MTVRQMEVRKKGGQRSGNYSQRALSRGDTDQMED
jgi:hypothetical protein